MVPTLRMYSRNCTSGPTVQGEQPLCDHCLFLCAAPFAERVAVAENTPTSTPPLVASGLHSSVNPPLFKHTVILHEGEAAEPDVAQRERRRSHSARRGGRGERSARATGTPSGASLYDQ